MMQGAKANILDAVGGTPLVRLQRVVPPDLHAELYAREPLVVALPRDHRLAGATRVPLASLAVDPWVLFPRTVAPLLHTGEDCPQ